MRDLIKYGTSLVIVIVATPLASFIGLVGTTLLYGFVALFLFNLDNPHPSFKKHVSAALVLWIVFFQLRKEYYTTVDYWVPAIAAAILAFIYFQRFKAREDKHWVDYLKLIGITTLVPATYLDSLLASITTPFICFFLCLTFLLDRLIIRRHMNKTTQIITFSIMALICLSFMIYAFIKADEAQKQKLSTEIARKEAVEEKKRADALEKLIHARAVEAIKAQSLAEEYKELLKSCQSK